MFSVQTLKKWFTLSAVKGFTLVELMIVMAVIAVLATMAFFGLGKAQAAARDVQRQQTMTAIRAALERYYGDNKIYPAPGVGWNAFITNLGSAYIAAPTDPCAGFASFDATGHPQDATPALICTPTQYVYTQPGGIGTYTLTLTKESGGTSVFLNPQ